MRKFGVIILFITISVGLFAETIILKNKDKITGTIIQQDEKQVIVKTDYGKITLKKNEISSIEIEDNSNKKANDGNITILQEGTTRFKFYKNDIKLSFKKVGPALGAVPEAQKLYLKAYRGYKGFNGMMVLGIVGMSINILPTAIAGIMALNPSNDPGINSDYAAYVSLGFGIASLHSIAFFIVGVIIRSKFKVKMKESVEMYNKMLNATSMIKGNNKIHLSLYPEIKINEKFKPTFGFSCNLKI